MRKMIDVFALVDCLNDQIELAAKLQRVYRKYGEACGIRQWNTGIAATMEDMDRQLKTEFLQLNQIREALEDVVRLSDDCEKNICE